MLMRYPKLSKKDKILCELLCETCIRRISVESVQTDPIIWGQHNSYYVTLYNDSKCNLFIQIHVILLLGLNLLRYILRFKKVILLLSHACMTQIIIIFCFSTTQYFHATYFVQRVYISSDG